MSDSLFIQMGGEFNLPVKQLRQRLLNTKALIFDWDGVFNSGQKGEIPSNFSEVDSMGVNMLRFGYYLLTHALPLTAIVTGETNETAMQWARREHLDAVYFQVKNKIEIAQLLEDKFRIEPHEIFFVFDDILDLSLAKEAGVRFLVKHQAKSLFIEYCRKNKLCDYITSRPGHENAIREISELSLHLIGKFDDTIEKRIEFDGDYSAYLQKRDAIGTQILKASSDGFESQSP